MKKLLKYFQKNKEVKDDSDLPAHTNSDNLETKGEKTARIRSLRIVYVETFIFGLSFSIVIAGVFPYLKQVT